jgi:hypothetical protein
MNACVPRAFGDCRRPGAGPKLGEMRFREHEVEFLWLLPVHQAEVRFRHSAGLEALEQRFDEAGFDIYDLNRRSVV